MKFVFTAHDKITGTSYKLALAMLAMGQSIRLDSPIDATSFQQNALFPFAD